VKRSSLAVDPRQSIENRSVIEGSPAPADVEAQIRAARAALATDVPGHRCARGEAARRGGAARSGRRCGARRQRHEGFALSTLAKFGARRLLFGLPTIWVLVTVVFVMVHLAPGDPLSFITGEGDISSDQLARLRAEYGLDRPLATQYALYLRKIVAGTSAFPIAIARRSRS
jgi:hypothetical protein